VLRGLREKFMTSSKFISITPCLEITGTKWLTNLSRRIHSPTSSQKETSSSLTPRHQKPGTLVLESWTSGNLIVRTRIVLRQTQKGSLSVVPKEKIPLRSLLEWSHRFRIHTSWRDSEAPPLPIYEGNTITISVIRGLINLC
jgi:hypothetical protein